jgi:hypothetical protein
VPYNRAMPIIGRRVEYEIEIEAPRDQVWAVLDDFERYPEWNPFTVSVRTDRIVGNPVELDVAMSTGRRSITERFDLYEPPVRMAWGLKMLAGLALKCSRIQELEEVAPGRTRYRTHETFYGPLAPLVISKHGSAVEEGFRANAEALKARAEQLRGG